MGRDGTCSWVGQRLFVDAIIVILCVTVTYVDFEARWAGLA